MKLIGAKFCAALVAFICLLSVAGCEKKVASPADPIAGWQIDFKTQPSQAVEKDYSEYLQTLPQNEKSVAGIGNWLKDGTGQHAIVIQIPLNGTWWRHVLIYDKDDKRIKTVKFIWGHYAC